MQDMVKKVVAPSSSSISNLGLLLLRVGIGLIFVRHGYGKLAAGPELWEKLGATMGYLGIHFWPTFWGLCAGIIEFVGGISLVLGLFVRSMVVFMAAVMVMAIILHVAGGDSWIQISHPLSLLFVFLSLLLLGSGRYSLDALLYRKL